MKKLACLTLFVLFANMLISCAKATPTPERVEGMLNPGDKIGTMTVEEHSPLTFTPDLRKYCGEYFPTETEAVTTTVDCELPALSRVRFDVGWRAANRTAFDSNWNAMTWEVHIDDHPINLDQFQRRDVRSVGDFGRWWSIDLVDVSPGQHTILVLWTSEAPIDDGFDVYAPGVHEFVVNFTVAEK